MSSFSERKTILLTVAAVSSCCFLWIHNNRRRRLVKTRRRVLVTGAASGIGKATVEYLVERGDFVYAADVHQHGVEEVAMELNKDKECVVPIAFDVRHYNEVSQAARQLQERFGMACVDAIVNVAGVIQGGPLVEMNQQDFKLVMDVNIGGMFLANKTFFPLLNRNYSRIINLSSEVGYSGVSAAFNAPYAMSKVAVESYSVALRQELSLLKDQRVDVTVINPGAMATEMVQNQLKGNSYWERALPGSLWRDELLKGNALAQSYMKRHKKDPIICAEAIYRAIHSAEPYGRLCPNMSWEMWAAGYTPQWILDWAIAQYLMDG